MSRYAALLLGALVVACTDSGPQAAAPIDPERPWRQEGDVIDSIFPMDVMIARFREGLDTVTALQGGADNPEALAEEFLAAVAAGDSSALVRMLVTRQEFGWLVFPEHIYAEPPYELDPAIHWLQVQASSAKGMARVLERYGSRSLDFHSLACTRDTVQFPDSEIEAWSPCTVRYAGNDSTLERRLFGTIIARDGVAKFVGFANEF